MTYSLIHILQKEIQVKGKWDSVQTNILNMFFSQALLIEPKNKEVIQLKEQLSEKIQQHNQITARAMEKMFQK